MQNLTAKLLGSSAWLTIEYVIGQALRLVSNVIISRILFPEAFGIMALVMVFLQGLEMLSDVGIRGAIIKSDNREEPTFLDTAWTIQVVRGCILFIAVLPLAPIYAQSFNEPQLVGLIMASAAINLIHGISPTKGILAGIAMQHKLLVSIRLIAVIAGTVATIISALLTHSIWSFILGAAVTNIVRVSLLYTIVPGRLNRFRFNKTASKDIFGFSMWVFMSSAASFGVNQLDKIIIGNFLGVKMLGLYNVAFFISSAPKLLFDSINSRIGQPLYSTKSNASLDKIQKFQAVSIGGASLALLIMSLISPFIIQFLYDERYIISAYISPFIAISLIPSILTATYSIALLAKGASRLVTTYMLIKFSIQLPLMYILISKYHLLGMIIALPLTEVLAYPVLIYYSKKHAYTNFKFDAFLFTAWLLGSALVFQVYSTHIDKLLHPLNASASEEAVTTPQD